MFRLKGLHSVAFAACIILAIIPACSGDPLGPEGQFQVTSSVDFFLIQMWNLDDADDTHSYQWENTGTQATVDISQGTSNGSVMLIIKDAAGTVVHQADVLDDNDTDTAVGVAGTWTIDLQLQNVTGSFDVSIMKTS